MQSCPLRKVRGRSVAILAQAFTCDQAYGCRWAATAPLYRGCCPSPACSPSPQWVVRAKHHLHQGVALRLNEAALHGVKNDPRRRRRTRRKPAVVAVGRALRTPPLMR
jgi:hypothetical protein